MESEHMQREEVVAARVHRVGIGVPGDVLRTLHRAMLIAAFVGLFASIYLLFTYIFGTPIVCGARAGCEIVRASPWAYSFHIPRPAFGVAFYFAIIFLLALHAYAPHIRPRAWRIVLLLASTVGLIESIVLTLVQWLELRAFCLWCLTSAAATTTIFFLSIFDGREPSAKGSIIRELRFLFNVFLAAILLGGVALYFLFSHAVSGA